MPTGTIIAVIPLMEFSEICLRFSSPSYRLLGTPVPQPPPDSVSCSKEDSFAKSSLAIILLLAIIKGQADQTQAGDRQADQTQRNCRAPRKIPDLMGHTT